MIKRLIRLFALMALSFSSYAEVEGVELTITDAYVELYTGPGSTYRIEHILLQGEKAEVIKQFADWFYLEGVAQKNATEEIAGQKKGWVHLDKLLDNRVDQYQMSFDEFLIHYEGDLRFDTGFRLGLLEQDFLYAIEIGHALSMESRVALNISMVPGRITETQILAINYEYLFTPQSDMVWYAGAGIGQLDKTPAAQAVGGEDKTYDVWTLSAGIVFARSKRMNMTTSVTQFYDKAEEEEVLTLFAVGLNYLY